MYVCVSGQFFQELKCKCTLSIDSQFFCKYGFDSSGKGDASSTHSIPWNKQRLSTSNYQTVILSLKKFITLTALLQTVRSFPLLHISCEKRTNYISFNHFEGNYSNWMKEKKNQTILSCCGKTTVQFTI